MSDPRQLEQSSVTLTRKAKGQVQFDVKVYDANAATAQKRATEIFDELTRKYPMPAEGGTKGEKS